MNKSFISITLFLLNLQINSSQAPQSQVVQHATAKSIILNNETAKLMIEKYISWHVSNAPYHELADDLQTCIEYLKLKYDTKQNIEKLKKDKELKDREAKIKEMNGILKTYNTLSDKSCSLLSERSSEGYAGALRYIKESPEAFFETLRLFHILKNTPYNLEFLIKSPESLLISKMEIDRNNAINLLRIGIPWFIKNVKSLSDKEKNELKILFKSANKVSIMGKKIQKIYKEAENSITDGWDEKAHKIFYLTLEFFENIVKQLTKGTTLEIKFIE